RGGFFRGTNNEIAGCLKQLIQYYYRVILTRNQDRLIRAPAFGDLSGIPAWESTDIAGFD
ncbi:MAG TPA: hypothetical protein DIV36_02190, partial [Verrucomicrobiales bacterium]|nr:hypothetical protein [Verrucomicrobiales bacterium]